MIIEVKGTIPEQEGTVKVDTNEVLRHISTVDLLDTIIERDGYDGIIPTEDPGAILGYLEAAGIPESFTQPIWDYLDLPITDKGTLDRWKAWATP